ncbi:GNAT family N-acetyltransferase [Paenibacillus sp. Marseille-P2973]|uniref:GNAT family N-acetyltransferase n=1 Tax=Paenibacillus sp. Marseille-P2973 TaxID=1871032 RepID=UPI001FFD70F3|nr:GNAT family N-acetyltransferase [Paenibacillus sp. Marseille-P2973]
MSYTIRPLSQNDIPFMWEMLYESLFVPEGQQPFNKEILKDPLISKYVEGWGREGDFGFIATNKDGKPMGSITARSFNERNKGFGYIDADVPELGMALLEDYRGKGIGKALLEHLFNEAKQRGIKRLSLSVDPGNVAAVKLYQRFGFEDVGMVGTSITMVARVK